MAHQKEEESRPQLVQDSTKLAANVKDLDDKSLEELVLSDLYYEIARDLPPDDVLTYMYQDNLVTDGQRDHYRMMKANNQPEVERSEYLLDCLRKGEPGFLEKLCNILRRIPPASHIADKIEGKRVQFARQQSNCKSEARTIDRTKRTKGEAHWMKEFKKLESKTRLQLRAKDREIKRLRNAIRELESENHTNQQRLLNEMKCQVELLSKWIDNKTEILPHTSTLAKMALSHDGKCDDIFGVTSESSSNQSTLERRPRPKRKIPSAGHNQQSLELSTIDDHSDTPKVATDNRQGVSPDSTVLQPFAVNVSHPATAVESDATDINRPLQVTEFTTNILPLPDVGKCVVVQNHDNEQDEKSLRGLDPTTVTLLNGTSIPKGESIILMAGTTPTSINGTKDEVLSASADEFQTPSILKSNTASRTPPPQCSGNGYSKPVKSFKRRKDLSAKLRQSDQDLDSDFKAVFRKIRGKDPPNQK